MRAAVATAAYRTARGWVASSQFAYLDAQSAAYLARVPDAQAKTDGIAVGTAATNAMLALRANGGCTAQPADAEVGQITPFTYGEPSAFLPRGPGCTGGTPWRTAKDSAHR